MGEHVTDDLVSLLLGEASRGVVLSAAAHLPACLDCQQELSTALIAHASLCAARRYAPEIVADLPRPVGEPAPSLPDISTVFAQARDLAISPYRRRRPPRTHYLLSVAAAVVVAVGTASLVLTTSGTHAHSIAIGRDIRLAAFDTGTRPASARLTGGQLTIDATTLPHLANRRYEVWLTDRTRTNLQPVGWLNAFGRAAVTVPEELVSRYTDIEVSVQRVDAASYDYSGTSVLRGAYR